MKNIALLITAILFMCNTITAQTQEIKITKETVKTVKADTVKKDSTKNEIVIKDSWSKTKSKVDKKNEVKKNVGLSSPNKLYYPKTRRDIRKYNKKGRHTKIGIGNTSFSVTESTDTTIISLGGNELVILDKGFGSTIKVREKRYRQHNKKFRGHWTGFELGVASFAKNNSNGFMELTYPKSSMVNINFLQGNIKLNGTKFGLVTGLGLSWYNFRFKDDFTMVDGKDTDGKPCTTQKAIKEVYPDMGSVKKSKLTVSYLTIPLLVEMQTNKRNTYFSAGIIAGVRLGSHTKVKFSDGHKEKDFGDFYLLPCKLDATARIGYKGITIWASYSLTNLFQKDKLYDNVNNKYINKTPIALGFSFNIF
ncbi:MAG: outer membrane beta-barrel protein [Marinifilaceae bacterium]